VIYVGGLLVNSTLSYNVQSCNGHMYYAEKNQYNTAEHQRININGEEVR
jgi:hypothetical protein